jgi:bifunctional UDP-N-acetylglucosamine pyrophosphorylase/glucosamine-1-phosphate N-acetyltransferase
LASGRSSRTLAAVVLAAGKGKRMKSERPKVLHGVCGRPALWYVLQAARAAKPSILVVVVGHGREEVEDVVRSWRLKPEPVFVVQGEPQGTGHAAARSETAVNDVDDVLVMAGDDPLVAGEHVRQLLRVHRRTNSAAAILTTIVDEPRGYGRVVRDGHELVGIVEEADASAEVRRIGEISTLVYVFRREALFDALPLVGRENRQREYYLPDALPILKEKGKRVAAIPVDLGGSLGINSRRGLAHVSRIMRARIIDGHMANGVTFVDPPTAYVDAGVRIGRDSVVLPLTFLEGDTRIGAACRIGPSTRIIDSTVGDETEITFAVVRGSRIGRRASIGPYASIRPGTVLADEAKAGTFVEIKASRVGRKSKVPHLSYVGDAVIGSGANIGAGTVTVNYDGFEKHRTVVGDEAHVGSDTMLVAPVKVGKRAWTGAGSAITKNVPDGALAVERAEQRIVRGYDERKRRSPAGAAGKQAPARAGGGGGGGGSMGGEVGGRD